MEDYIQCELVSESESEHAGAMGVARGHSLLLLALTVAHSGLEKKKSGHGLTPSSLRTVRSASIEQGMMN